MLWIPTPIAAGLSAQLGPDRDARLFPMKSLQKQGGRFIIASDGPLFWQTPLASIEAAITREQPGGSPTKLAPAEAIDLATAIRAYTLNAAYLMGHDDRVGSIEAGKVADIIVLDRNLFEIPVREIGSTLVLQTVFNGAVVFDAGSDPANEEAIEDKYAVELEFAEDDSLYWP